MIGMALVAIVVAMLLVRIGWTNSRWLAGGGWALAGVALLVLASQAGAWGIATGTTLGMLAALLLVLQAGWVSPRRAVRPAREAVQSVTLPRATDMARRVAVFLLVVPVGFAATQLLAFAVQAALHDGAARPDANGIALTWFLQPILWTLVMSWQMTRPGPRAMALPALAPALLALVVWSAA